MPNSFFTALVLLVLVVAAVPSHAAGANPLTQKERELINGKPKIQIWVPESVDVNLGTLKKESERPGSETDANTNGKLLNAAGGENKIKRAGTLTTDENNTSKGDSSAANNSGGGDEGAVSPPPPRTDTQSASGSQAFGRWYPVCMFADETLDPEMVNSAVKSLADEGAACNVNVVVFPITIKTGYPDNYSMINAQSTNWCNIAEIGGANAKASATTCVNHSLTADKMCGWKPTDPPPPPNTSGCAAVRSDEETKADLKRLKTLNGFEPKKEGDDSSEAVLPSIEDVGFCDPFTVNHESIGHSALGWPNGSGAGFGIKNLKSPNATHDGESWEKSAACARLRSVAMPDPDLKWRYDRSRTVYYTPSLNPIDLMSSGKLFGNPSPPPNSPPKIYVNNGVPTDQVFEQDFFDGKKSTDNSPVASPGSSPDPEKHRKKAGASLAMDEGAPGKERAPGRTSGEDDIEDIQSAIEVPKVAVSSNAKGSATLAVDEGASKNSSSSNVQGGVNSRGVAGSAGVGSGVGAGATSSGQSSYDSPMGSMGSGGTPDSSAPLGKTVVSRPASLRKGKENPDELDPTFFRSPAINRKPDARSKGSTLRQSEGIKR